MNGCCNFINIIILYECNPLSVHPMKSPSLNCTKKLINFILKTFPNPLNPKGDLDINFLLTILIQNQEKKL